MKLVYIHGANATAESFNYIREHLNYPNEIVIEYDSRNGFENNLENMKQTLKNTKDMFFIAHSLGGIYALHLADIFPKKVLGAVTISTPYGGAEVADYAKYFLPFSRLLRDVGPKSLPMRTADKIKIHHPWLNVVTTRGDCPWMIQANDGVVTLESMRHRSDIETIDIHKNHYEVVISKEVVEIIKSKIISNR
jgi:pimeloyl-ACP methyl ester carboxylesterase